MPPLCTAGFGLATQQYAYFWGAFYLFCINSVFIALSTAVVVGAIAHPQRMLPHPTLRKRVRFAVYAVVAATLLPSLFLTYQLIRAELYRHRAQEFIRQEFTNVGLHSADQQILPESEEIEVALLGEH